MEFWMQTVLYVGVLCLSCYIWGQYKFADGRASMAHDIEKALDLVKQMIDQTEDE